MVKLQENRLLDLYEKYQSKFMPPLDEEDRQNFKNAELLWQEFLKKKGYSHKEITREEFGDLCLEFMSFSLGL